MKWLVGCAAVFLLAIGSASAQPPPPGYAPIPPPRRDVVPPPPSSRVVWEPGHWYWNGVRYIWIDGHYVDQRGHGGRYIEGRWVRAPHRGRWIWRPAHWG